MKISRVGASVAAATALVLGLSACSSSNTPAASPSAKAGNLTGTLSGAGASTQESAMTAWIDGFKAVQPGVTVQYNPVGSGAGRTQFLAGSVTFAGSDASLKTDEWEKSKALCGTDGAFAVPAYISPIAVAYNLPSVKENIKMDADTIAKVFSGKITTWNDPAIASQNAGVTLPSTKITVVHRADDSGTTENFTDYLHAAAPSVWTDAKAQAWPKQLTGQESAQQTTGVVSLTTSTEGAITYADASAIGTLGTVAVKVGNDYVKYTAEAAAKSVSTAKKVGGQAPQDMGMKLDRTSTEAGTYPVVLVSYQIFCTTYKDQATVDAVKAFGEYVLSAEGQKAAADAAGSAPIGGDTEKEALAAIATIKVA
ncbi:phosphate ABC transporter substrate-binding protein PstS [Raineyella sp. LH-20]|uniref:phosphate ABC transporter substrate-binding protein PstS n=1 Tax=Raineyella sp. LH-20 TaxID=3081204 RepID=UPI00295296B5|nr:phosphate ABC transporter substrate-binding protein PstS [Raineyella sp. LH-20]WOP17289.1 phosphate ABC transporter substrate-binding protein PstS [Raineyella sp. LH-20]